RARTTSSGRRETNKASPARPRTGCKEAAGRDRRCFEFEVADKMTSRTQRTAPYPKIVTRSIRPKKELLKAIALIVRTTTATSWNAPSKIRPTNESRNERRKYMRPPSRVASGTVPNADRYAGRAIATPPSKTRLQSSDGYTRREAAVNEKATR